MWVFFNLTLSLFLLSLPFTFLLYWLFGGLPLVMRISQLFS